MTRYGTEIAGEVFEFLIMMGNITIYGMLQSISFRLLGYTNFICCFSDCFQKRKTKEKELQGENKMIKSPQKSEVKI